MMPRQPTVAAAEIERWRTSRIIPATCNDPSYGVRAFNGAQSVERGELIWQSPSHRLPTGELFGMKLYYKTGTDMFNPHNIWSRCFQRSFLV
ncbi:unnamed protein product, partial [Iphiclides podalirius]